MRDLRARDRTGCPRRGQVAGPGRPGGVRARGVHGHAGGARAAADRRPHRHRRQRGRRPAAGRLPHRRGGQARRRRDRPARGPGGRRARRLRRHVADRGGPARIVAHLAGHVHAQDGRRAGRPRQDRPAAPVGDNVVAIADAFGRTPADVTAIVLDRPRHHDLIDEIRSAGARIKLIQDGDVTASISAAVRGTNDHLAIGIGGTRQAVLAAAALRCLGGELQAQLWPVSRREITPRTSTASTTSSACSGSTTWRRRTRSSPPPASPAAISCAVSGSSPTARARTRS